MQDPMDLLIGTESGPGRYDTEADDALAGLYTVGIVDQVADHLQSTADGQHGDAAP